LQVGHTFGKAHGAGDAGQVGNAPEASGLTETRFWLEQFTQARVMVLNTISSGLEGAWNEQTQLMG